MSQVVLSYINNKEALAVLESLHKEFNPWTFTVKPAAPGAVSRTIWIDQEVTPWLLHRMQLFSRGPRPGATFWPASTQEIRR